MQTWIGLLGAFVLFWLGVRLSAFFSGSETGFYRVSFLRLSIDANAGDRTARRLVWFARNPSYFVATTLVGNNVANYVTTAAIGVAVVSIVHGEAGWIEIVATILISPVVFVFGELVPKNLYYRAPLALLRRGARWFSFFFGLFLVVSFPLIWITKLLERLGGATERSLDLVLGRSRLVQVLSEGHEVGLLTDVQSRLVHGLMHTAAEPVTDSITPAARVLGLPDDAPREALLEHARLYGMTSVPVRRADDENSWYGYVRVLDATVGRKPLAALVRSMPRIEPTSSKLEALLSLRNAGASFGIVARDGTVQGIASERGLVEQLFRSPHAPPARFPAPK
jgi:putative hemolysin